MPFSIFKLQKMRKIKIDDKSIILIYRSKRKTRIQILAKKTKRNSSIHKYFSNSKETIVVKIKTQHEREKEREGEEKQKKGKRRRREQVYILKYN